MKEIRKPILIAVLYGFVVIFGVSSFELGPRPLLDTFNNVTSSRVSGMYSYQRSLLTSFILTEDYGAETIPGEDVPEYHQLAVSAWLFPGVNAAVGLLTNQFNISQQDVLPYDEIKGEITFHSWYLGFRSLRQSIRTHYEVPDDVFGTRTEVLVYYTQLDVAKFGISEFFSIWQDDTSNGGRDSSADQQYLTGIDFFAGLTHIRLDTARPVFDADANLTSEPFHSNSFGLTTIVSYTSVFQDADPDDAIRPYWTVGFSSTLLGITQIDGEWTWGATLGRFWAGEGVADNSFEIGTGLFVLSNVRFDANLNFNGVVIDNGELEQAVGKAGFALSVEVRI